MKPVYAVTGVTGQVGSIVAIALLEEGCAVRAVVRNPEKAGSWANRGCEIAVAEMDDPQALAEAFRGVDGAFILLPPNFDPDPDFTAPLQIIAAIHDALLVAAPPRIVVLSTIGGQVEEPTILKALYLMERSLGSLPLNITFLRAGWFMENTKWDIPSARENGVVQSFLQPLDKPIPMVATEDVGRAAASLLRRNDAPEVVEIEGPSRVTPNEIAATLSKLLGRDVRAEAVPRHTWEALFRSQGSENPQLRARMLDGFNEGWIEFEKDNSLIFKGTTTLESSLRKLTDAN